MVDYVKWGRSHYERNKPIYKARANARRAKIKIETKAYIRKYLLANPCVDCGEADPIVLEFDHRDRSKKKFTIGEAMRVGYRVSFIIDEIAKCDVRCANCHRRKSIKEAGGTR